MGASAENIQEDLEKAFETYEAGEETTELTTPEETGGSEKNTEESVGTTKTPEELLSEKTPIEEEKTGDEETKSGEQKKEERVAGPEEKAPASWKPEIREEWNNLPASVRAEITRREAAYSAGIQRYATDAKMGDTVRKTLAPYAQIMAMEGADEVSAVANLARHAALMRTGTPQEKAKTFAGLIQHYNIDVEMLDNMLVGEDPMTPEQKALMDRIDERLKPVDALLGEAARTRSAVVEKSGSEISGEIVAFEQDPKNEFLSDVRMDMADILELAAKRGQKMTLAQAYDKACQINPDVSAALAKRAEIERLRKSSESLKGKTEAASSLAGGNAATGVVAADNIEDALSQAWEAHSRE